MTAKIRKEKERPLGDGKTKQTQTPAARTQGCVWGDRLFDNYINCTQLVGNKSENR